MPEIKDGQTHIDSFLKFMPARTDSHSMTAAADAETIGERATDTLFAQLSELARQESLWDGRWEYEDKMFGKPYPSQSEADFALIGAIARQAHNIGIPRSMAADAVIRVFEQSGLYRPEKRHRVVTRDIPKLIESHYVSEVSKPEADKVGDGGSTPRLGSGRINYSSTPPPPRDYVVDELLVAGKVAVLAGLGGVSKTMLSMQLAVSTAIGRVFLGKQVKVGSVLMILGEEDQEEIDRRFNAIFDAWGLSNQEIQMVSERVRAHPMNGLDARLTRTENGSLEATDFTDEIVMAANKLVDESQCPLALVVLDHAGLIHGGQFNAREDVVQTMRQVNFLTKSVSTAVLVLAHSPKTAIGKEESDQLDVAGSMAWVDLARSVFVLRTMTEKEGKDFGISAKAVRSNYVSFSVVKNNYGPTDQRVWLVRHNLENHSVSILNDATLTKPQPVNASSNLSAQVKAFIKQHPGQYTKTGLRDTQGGKSGPFKCGKASLAAAVEDLLAIGELQLVPPTDAQRVKFGLRAQVTQILEAI